MCIIQRMIQKNEVYKNNMKYYRAKHEKLAKIK